MYSLLTICNVPILEFLSAISSQNCVVGMYNVIVKGSN